MNNWYLLHDDAWNAPQGAERPIVGMLKAWADYAETHKHLHHSNIGEDYVLGDAWARIGYALRGLLNGSLERLDGGTLDGFIYTRLQDEGFDPDTEERAMQES